MALSFIIIKIILYLFVKTFRIISIVTMITCNIHLLRVSKHYRVHFFTFWKFRFLWLFWNVALLWFCWVGLEIFLANVTFKLKMLVFVFLSTDERRIESLISLLSWLALRSLSTLQHFYFQNKFSCSSTSNWGTNSLLFLILAFPYSFFFEKSYCTIFTQHIIGSAIKFINSKVHKFSDFLMNEAISVSKKKKIHFLRYS